MSVDTHTYANVIIGAGAGGSAAARVLAEAGQSVLVVERGGFLPQEAENWEPDAILGERRYQTHERWDDAIRGDRYRPQAYYRVGGNTKCYGGVLQRMRARDFEQLDYPEGASPAWPLTYAELSPHYDEAEAWFCIHGQTGEDPTEPPRIRGRYPHGPIDHEPRIAEIAAALADRGLHPTHAPLAIDTAGDDPARHACIRCATCDPFPCRIHAKCDAETAALRPALATGNVELWTGARVRRLLPGPHGRSVTAVEIEIDDEIRVVGAERVFLAAGAINSACVLLASACDAWPGGCGNAHDRVGRGLMQHVHSAIHAFDDRPNPTTFQKTLCVHDFYFGSDERGIAHPLGAVQLTGKATWHRVINAMRDGASQADAQRLAERTVDWWITSEDLPRDTNRVELADDGRPRVAYTPNNVATHEQLCGIWRSIQADLGYETLDPVLQGREVVWHQAGTCRFGDDPKGSVLDRDCRVHGIENLHVVDSSFMPSMGSVNLTLTLLANSIRVTRGLVGGS